MGDGMNWTRWSVALAFVALLTADVRIADAQALGYGVAGIGGVQGFYGSFTTGQFAGGGELLAKGRAGVTGSVGMSGNGSGALTTISFGGVWHPVPMSTWRRYSPYVTSGISLLGDRDVAFPTWNVGGGVDTWTRERIGVRLDVRDHLRSDFRGVVHYWTVGAGVVFR
jgi:hypothetical protein